MYCGSSGSNWMQARSKTYSYLCSASTFCKRHSSWKNSETIQRRWHLQSIQYTKPKQTHLPTPLSMNSTLTRLFQKPCLHEGELAYVADSVHRTSSRNIRRHARYNDTHHFTVSDRAFPVAAARAWNALLARVRSVPSLSIFRRQLKTHLFRVTTI